MRWVAGWGGGAGPALGRGARISKWEVCKCLSVLRGSLGMGSVQKKS